jgi:hypothetical protein
MGELSYAECHQYVQHAECRYAEYHYADCRGAFLNNKKRILCAFDLKEPFYQILFGIINKMLMPTKIGCYNVTSKRSFIKTFLT